MKPELARITYLSPPAPVSMSEWYYGIANLEHFWVRRRFDVLRRLADPILRQAKHVAEIGCGNGVVQRNIEDTYGLSVAGFELIQLALEKSVSRRSPLYCYDIHQRHPEFREHFDVLVMFDVLEHIADESAFLESVKFHLAKSGTLLINVPAHQFLFSEYDRAAGHYRRYSMRSLTRVVEQNGFHIRAITYWGLPLAPLLLARKAITSMQRSEQQAYSSGFDPGPRLVNRSLSLLARCEPLPQRWLGTSVMAVLELQT
ncbi:MAG TPA: class I SAM-dependent methyltransferase [Bryobacteraceae bacterium]|jgi:SAM-dependent methyltransferase